MLKIRELEFSCGANLIDAMKYLYKTASEGNECYGYFNCVKLTSDMDIDEAYIAVTGRTFREYVIYEESCQRLKKKTNGGVVCLQ